MGVQNNYKWMVCVRCSTFNHSPYIVDAMNGFCMQETSFPYVCFIIDDCSTDGEQMVIKQYLNDHFDLFDPLVVRKEETEDYSLIFSRHKSNKNCFFAVLFLKYNHFRKKNKLQYLSEWRDYSKYEALCEGDDYWCHEKKLQIQVDYMEQHNSVSIYTHNAIRTYPDGRRSLFNKKVSTGEYNLRQCLRMRWFTPTASFLYRNNVVISPLWRKNGSNGDMAILFSNLMKGDLFYSDIVMSVYNYCTPTSLSASTNRSSLYKKKRGMLKTINRLTHNKYISTVFPLITLTYVKQTIWNVLQWLHLK